MILFWANMVSYFDNLGVDLFALFPVVGWWLDIDQL